MLITLEEIESWCRSVRGLFHSCYPPPVSIPPAHAIRRLKDAGRQSVWLVHRPGEQPRTLKTWPLTPLLLVKLALGIAQPQRQIRGARRLARAGIPTAEVCCRRVAWGRRQVEIELGWVEGASAWELVSSESPSISERRRASAAVGGMVAQLIEAGLFNRDVKLSNLVVATCMELLQRSQWLFRKVIEGYLFVIAGHTGKVRSSPDENHILNAIWLAGGHM